MDFENVNINVTRKSFGSRVDKEFQREGVVPIKDRNKSNKYDYAAESAKYNELNKKVETRRLTDVKESRAFNIALQEGYDKVRDVLIKDFMSEIVVESLLVDKEVVYNNIKSIVMLVEEQVDAIGGYNGIKEIAESTGNQLLNNIISACEAVCAKVGKRNLQESNGKATKLDFNLTKDECEEYNYLKQANGSETVVDIVKDKVLKVVKDEQQTNAENKAVMDEIESKIKELETPVNEAMNAIFNKTGIEESSLFNSLLRVHYTQLLETNSSAIFETNDMDDETIDAFEDEEFKMSEIELLGNDGEGEDLMDDDSEDEIVEEASIQKKARKYKDEKLARKIVKKEEEIARVKARLAMEKDEDYKADMKEDIQMLQQELKVLKNEYLHRDRQSKIKTDFYAKEAGEIIDIIVNGTVEQLSEALDNFAMEIETEASGCRTKSSAKKCKEAVRNIQNASEEIVEEGLLFNEVNKKINNVLQKSIIKLQNVKSIKKSIENEEKIIKKINEVLESRETELTSDKMKRLAAQTIIWSLHPAITAAIFKFYPNKSPKWLLNLFKDCSERYVRLAKERLSKLEGKGEDVKSEGSNDKAYESMKPTVSDIFTLMESRCDGKKKVKEETEKPEVAPSVNNEPVKEEIDKLLDEEIILCPICDEEDCICDTITENLSMSEFKSRMKTFFEKLLSRSITKRDFAQVRVNLKEILRVTDNVKDIEVLEADAKLAIKQLEKAKTYYPDAKDKLDDQINWINTEYKDMLTTTRERLEKKQVIESFVDRLDNSCDILSNVIETHEVALNGVLESMTHEIDDKIRLIPYLQPNDCNLSNLEFAYKSKLVCESLKEGAMYIVNENDSMVVERAIKLNLDSINESISIIKDIEKLSYKTKILESCKQYLEKVKTVLDKGIVPNENVTESTALFNSVEDVDRIFNQVKEYTLIESTNKDLMELVMAETIVEYTIMETFNTLNLVKYDKDSVRQMARKNISR